MKNLFLTSKAPSNGIKNKSIRIIKNENISQIILNVLYGLNT